MKRPLFLTATLLAALGFLALGIWQVERRAWKLALIDRVGSRIAAPPAPLPATPDPPSDEYRRVRVSGTFDHSRETLVQALTERGGGYWVMTPLRSPVETIIINRGFVPTDHRMPATRALGDPAGEVAITGLLRASEPGGTLLRSNDPTAGRWYSRDVAAIGRARGIASPYPMFVDADATPNAGGYPVGGLTVVRFRNNHLVYALTWVALAGLSIAAALRLLKHRER